MNDNIIWTDYVITICNIVTTIVTILGALFVVIQIRNATKAQQDKKAPLIVLEQDSKAFTSIKIKNAGELSAIITKISVKIFFNDNTWTKKNITKREIINNGNSINFFSIKEFNDISKDKIAKLKILIKYDSPLNDRKRKCCTDFIRGGGNG